MTRVRSVMKTKRCPSAASRHRLTKRMYDANDTVSGVVVDGRFCTRTLDARQQITQQTSPSIRPRSESVDFQQLNQYLHVTADAIARTGRLLQTNPRTHLHTYDGRYNNSFSSSGRPVSCYMFVVATHTVDNRATFLSI